MRPTNNGYDRAILEETCRLLREINSQRMRWKKLGKMIRLSALVHASTPYAGSY